MYISTCELCINISIYILRQIITNDFTVTELIIQFAVLFPYKEKHLKGECVQSERTQAGLVIRNCNEDPVRW